MKDSKHNKEEHCNPHEILLRYNYQLCKGETVMNAFEKYQNEVKEKWGNTAAYQEHQQKSKDYSKEKWDGLAEGMDQIMASFSQCMNHGDAADSNAAQGLVKALQEHISANFYPCTDAILTGLGQMYIADERFKNNIDKHAAGTAEFISKAIAAYCRK